MSATPAHGVHLSRDVRNRTNRTRTRARTRVRGDWRAPFLEAFAEHGTVRAACLKVGVGRSTVYDERHRNSAFAVAFAEAELEITESLEGEAIRRALDGSDRLMEFLLKARCPERYSDRAHLHHSGTVAQPVVLTAEEEAAELQSLALALPGMLALAAGPSGVVPPPDA